MNQMTPQQLVRYCILAVDARWSDKELPSDLTGEQVDGLYEELEEADAHWDAKNELREGEQQTGIEAPYSRHYESQSVAAQAPNGQWVGWTYWYGGGKHGEPEAIDWMEHAYLLDHQSEEKVVTVHSFTRRATQ